MPDPTSTEAAITADIIAALKTIELPDGSGIAAVFAVQDAQSFADANDPLRGVSLGVAPGGSESGRGGDADQPHVSRLALEIVVKVPATVATSGESDAHERINAIVAKVRAKLLESPLRGGHALRVAFGGQFIDGTSVDGKVRQIASAANQGFVAAAVPVACGFVP